MDQEGLYNLVDLPREVLPPLERARAGLDLRALEPYLEEMLDRKTAADAYKRLQRLLGEDPGAFKMLYCQLECARRAWRGYQARQIGGGVYRDTMRCFSRFLLECRRKTGRLFFDRGWWTYRQTSMGLFRIGALEYEFCSYAGENAIAVHIPSDADFSPQSVDASLAGADAFFRAHYPDYGYALYTCNSWLLSPALGPLLPEGSHIRAFQRRFRLVSEDPGDREYWEWLFQVPAETAVEALPARTRLQKGVRELLCCGGAVGSACGVMDKRRSSPTGEKGGEA